VGGGRARAPAAGGGGLAAGGGARGGGVLGALSGRAPIGVAVDSCQTAGAAGDVAAHGSKSQASGRRPISEACRRCRSRVRSRGAGGCRAVALGSAAGWVLQYSLPPQCWRGQIPGARVGVRRRFLGGAPTRARALAWEEAAQAAGHGHAAPGGRWRAGLAAAAAWSVAHGGAARDSARRQSGRGAAAMIGCSERAVPRRAVDAAAGADPKHQGDGAQAIASRRFPQRQEAAWKNRGPRIAASTRRPTPRTTLGGDGRGGGWQQLGRQGVPPKQLVAAG
jgi:hypothetical protein